MRLLDSCVFRDARKRKNKQQKVTQCALSVFVHEAAAITDNANAQRKFICCNVRVFIFLFTSCVLFFNWPLFSMSTWKISSYRQKVNEKISMANIHALKVKSSVFLLSQSLLADRNGQYLTKWQSDKCSIYSRLKIIYKTVHCFVQYDSK